MIFQPADAFRDATRPATADGADPHAPPGLRGFLRALCAPDDRRARAFAAATARRIGPERACLELLTPAARRLGQGWVDDSCSFAAVTVALSRLHAILHALERDWEEAVALPGAAGAALICPAPGEQHRFGAAMLAQFFRAAGWSVSAPSAPSREALLAMVKRRAPQLVGLSLSCDAGLPALARLVGELRQAARGAEMIVLVGGPVFLARAEAVSMTGADGCAADGPAAVALASGLRRRVAQAA